MTGTAMTEESEFADIFNAFGSKVTLVEALPRILPLEDHEASDTLTKSFKKRKIDVHAGAKVVKAEVGNLRHVGAPMPGLIAQINVRAGDLISKGDALMTIEAMKMQTSIRAERDGRIAEVVAQPGAQVEAKDLLLVFEA